jgi:plasmid stabilization system protein ParE
LSPAYILTNAAEADIRSIVRCTRQQWGAAQTRAYMVKLEQGIARLARGLGHQRDMGAMHAGLRMARCERHYVFCLDREDAPPLVLAVLHERMDLIQRIGDRLA